MDVEKLIKDLRIACAGNQHNIMGVAATAITDLLARAEAAEARVRELETSFRTEKCENGPECAELGRVRKALAEAEARAEKAEREGMRRGGVDEYGDGYCKNPDGIDNIAKENDFCSYGEKANKL